MHKFHICVNIVCLALLWTGCRQAGGSSDSQLSATISKKTDTASVSGTINLKDSLPVTPESDTARYRKLIHYLAHDSVTSKWPKDYGHPPSGAILPFKRIVAYYGNFYSRHMGILGSLSEKDLIENLGSEVSAWNKADSLLPVIPAIHYIAVTAQSSPGKGSKYRLRMPDHQIEKAISLGRKIEGITILDVQVGHSTVWSEVPLLEKHLIHPDVHLALDPEWSMKNGKTPGSRIGTMDAGDVNYAISYLSDLVKKHNLPPKVLVVHRFTKGMISNSDKIKPTPEVQVVINMDGFGFPAKKRDSYRRFVAGYPVQYTGFKLFYKNDKWTKPHRLMTPDEILGLYPRPIYIQYQ